MYVNDQIYTFIPSHKPGVFKCKEIPIVAGFLIYDVS